MLEAAVDAVCADTLAGLSSPELLATLARMEVVQRRLAAPFLR